MVALSGLTSHLQGLVPSLVRNQQKVVSLDKPRIRLFWGRKKLRALRAIFQPNNLDIVAQL